MTRDQERPITVESDLEATRVSCARERGVVALVFEAMLFRTVRQHGPSAWVYTWCVQRDPLSKASPVVPLCIGLV